MLFHSVQQYVQQVEDIVPWHDRIHTMATSFHQFSVACTKHYPAPMFCLDARIGTIGVDAKIVAAYMHWLRYKGESSLDGKGPPARKVSTIQNMWQQAKSGLLSSLSPSTAKPDWLTCSPHKIPILKRILTQWRNEDLKNMPIKSHLLEEHVEEFCLEAIWYHMQAGTPYLLKNTCCQISVWSSTVMFRFICSQQMPTRK